MTNDSIQAVTGEIAVTVVVASFSGETLLADCISSITSEPVLPHDVEVIVATTLSGASLARLRLQFPQVRFLPQPELSNVFALRAAGVAAATGRFILLTEDHVRVSSNWVSLLHAALSEGHDVVGGPVENGRTETAYGWGLYFCEYGVHTPPTRGGPTPVLSGLNIGYTRQALHATRDVWTRELHENEINDKLCELGRVQLWMVPEAVVDIRLCMTPRQAIDHLATGGRQYGRYRVLCSSSAKRMLLILASPLIPVVLFMRICIRVFQRRPTRILRVLQSSPWIALLLASWCYGEASGYLTAGRVSPSTANATPKRGSI